ncbi:MAG: hypothetical protein ABT25_28765 [Variovorax sp. SCN 67-20]|nr:MAG: hypothetical protein ABT25_28765 [Variovorax sp. SCN 67-20]
MPMDMDDVAGACSLMQFIDILGDDDDFVASLQGGNRVMRGVRCRLPGLPAALVVEVEHHFGSMLPALRARYFLP